MLVPPPRLRQPSSASFLVNEKEKQTFMLYMPSPHDSRVLLIFLRMDMWYKLLAAELALAFDRIIKNATLFSGRKKEEKKKSS